MTDIDIEKFYEEVKENKFLEGYQKQYKSANKDAKSNLLSCGKLSRGAKNDFENNNLTRASENFGRATASLLTVLQDLEELQKQRNQVLPIDLKNLIFSGVYTKDHVLSNLWWYGVALKLYEDAFKLRADPKSMFENRFIRVAKKTTLEKDFRKFIQQGLEEFERGYNSV